MFDLDRIRAETPGSLHHVFLDSAGSSLPPTRVVDAEIAHLRREAEVGGYRAATERAADLAEVPRSLARVIGAADGTIALTDSATRAWNQFVAALPWAPGDRVLITATEYASNALALLQRVHRDGISVEIVPSVPSGDVDLDALASMLDDRVRLVSLTHVPSNSGLINPVQSVVELAHAHGALVLLDACQSVGHLAIDAESLGIDALSASGRKWMRAPRGTGFLYVRPDLIESLTPSAPDLRGGVWAAPDAYELVPDARRFELWEASIAGRLGLGVAADLLLELGTQEVELAILNRSQELRERLRDARGVTLRDQGEKISGIVTFTLDGIPPSEVKLALERADVTVSVSHAASTLIDMRKRGLPSVVRASPHYFVTDEQLDQMVAALPR
ncbi:MAG: aminotransferase class V-fold PLP-dependent enzyme [Aeromicrobium sp.]